MDGEDEDEPPDVTALVQVIEEGFADGIVLVMSSWCGRQPKGPLIDAVVRGRIAVLGTAAAAAETVGGRRRFPRSRRRYSVV